MEEKRAEEISTGRIEITSGKMERPDKQINSGSGKKFNHASIEENTPESETLPVCTRTPRMLITGKSHYMKHLQFILMIEVSASAQMRDELRLALQTSLNKDISLVELDYQPSN